MSDEDHELEFAMSFEAAEAHWKALITPQVADKGPVRSITNLIGADRLLGQPLPPDTKAVVLDARMGSAEFSPNLVVSTFSARYDNTLMPDAAAELAKQYLANGVSVFVAGSPTLTLGELDMTDVRLESVVRAGGVNLGFCDADLDTIVAGVSETFAVPGTKILQEREVRHRFFRPGIAAHEVRPITNFLRNGGEPSLGKFAYGAYEHWLALKEDPQYSKLAKTGEKSFLDTSDKMLDAMDDRGISDVYSMGPSPEMDKVLLQKLLAKRKTQSGKEKIKYHAIDVSLEAVRETEAIITEHLSQVDESWRDYIEIVPEEPKLFDQVRADKRDPDADPFDEDKPDKPVAVIYAGGQIANEEGTLESVKTISNSGGILIADVHLRKESKESDELLWKYFYDRPPAIAMFESATTLMVPDLATKRDKWGIAVSYTTNEPGPNKISYDLNVPWFFDTTFMHMSLNLIPTEAVVRPRRLIISKKFTEEEFYAEAGAVGYTRVTENIEQVKDLPKRFDGLYAGVMTSIVAWGPEKRTEKPAGHKVISEPAKALGEKLGIKIVYAQP